MAPTSYAIDPEWGESLVGLRMAVPLSWWPGYTGTELSLGKIAKFDGAASPQSLLAVDDESSDTYAMRYDTVLAYAQVERPTFGSFRLPDTMSEETSPDDTVVVWGRGRGRRRRGHKRRRVRARASSLLPPLTSRADSASDDISGDKDGSDDNNDDVLRLQGRRDGDAGDADDDDNATDDDDNSCWFAILFDYYDIITGYLLHISYYCTT